ncbi:MAG TPA: class I SAM-dependent methyltransferase [Acidimicrobiales bacterium]|jgi:SAM-dependent methyltransferase
MNAGEHDHAVELTSCPNCHSSLASTVNVGAHQLRRCQDCGLVYAPRYLDPAKLYVEGYHSGGCGDFGVDVSLPAWQDFLDFVGERRLDMLDAMARPPGRLLDVGCGTGNTLHAAALRGWDTVGVELVPSAVEAAVERFGLDVRNCTLEESGLEEESFDVVATCHVLEHMADANGFLSSIARWIKPGGLLFVEVPNWNSMDRRAHADAWYGFRPLEHVGHYTPRTLARTLRRVGLRPVALRTPFYRRDDQTVGQILTDLGLSRLHPTLIRRPFSVPLPQGDVILRGPNALMRQAFNAVGWAESAARTGVVIVMMAEAGRSSAGR